MSRAPNLPPPTLGPQPKRWPKQPTKRARAMTLAISVDTRLDDHNGRRRRRSSVERTGRNTRPARQVRNDAPGACSPETAAENRLRGERHVRSSVTGKERPGRRHGTTSG